MPRNNPHWASAFYIPERTKALPNLLVSSHNAPHTEIIWELTCFNHILVSSDLYNPNSFNSRLPHHKPKPSLFPHFIPEQFVFIKILPSSETIISWLKRTLIKSIAYNADSSPPSLGQLCGCTIHHPNHPYPFKIAYVYASLWPDTEVTKIATDQASPLPPVHQLYHTLITSSH